MPTSPEKQRRRNVCKNPGRKNVPVKKILLKTIWTQLTQVANDLNLSPLLVLPLIFYSVQLKVKCNNTSFAVNYYTFIKYFLPSFILPSQILKSVIIYNIECSIVQNEVTDKIQPHEKSISIFPHIHRFVWPPEKSVEN